MTSISKEFTPAEHAAHLARLGHRRMLVEAFGCAFVDRDGVRWHAPGALSRGAVALVEKAEKAEYAAPSRPATATTTTTTAGGLGLGRVKHAAGDTSDLVAEFRAAGGLDDDFGLERYLSNLPVHAPEGRPERRAAGRTKAVDTTTDDLLRDLLSVEVTR